jgi:hypothetical protein
MAINTRAYDWEKNNFGATEFDDLRGWAFTELGNQYFNSFVTDNFTSVTVPSTPSLSAITVGSASYTDQSVSAPTYTELEVISENF